jgi:hypothetical protein
MGGYDMLALGSCLAGVGILVAGLLALLFRHPNAPRWSRLEIVPMLLCVPLAGLIGIGLGYTAFGLSLLVKGTGNPRELLVLVGVLIGVPVLWRVLGIRRRLRAYATAAAAASPDAYLTTQPRS